MGLMVKPLGRLMLKEQGVYFLNCVCEKETIDAKIKMQKNTRRINVFIPKPTIKGRNTSFATGKLFIKFLKKIA